MPKPAKEQPAIAREGFPFIAIASVLVALAYFIHPFLLGFTVLLWLFVVYFFRNPPRIVPQEKGSLICPADGKIIFAGEVHEDRYLKRPCFKISIFMSPFNVHVNRIPVEGVVTQVSYNKGKFFGAYSDKASLDNEQNAVVIKTAEGEEILFVQIAGFLARRIVCYAAVGDVWKAGDIFGLIRFGSRMDVYFPSSYQSQISLGQHVKAGETLLARRM